MSSEALPVIQRSNTPLLLFSDYHMHPQGHRVQSYTQELLQPWVDSARRLGLKDIAFTDHDRYYTGIDFDEIDRLRERNPDLRVRAGIELDNDPVHSPAGRKWIEKNWDKLDFVLGSVHSWSVPIRCSTACRMARRNSRAGTSMRCTQITFAVSAN